jgi:uncharacterized protein
MKNLMIGVILCAALSTAFGQHADANAPASKEDVERYLAVMQSHEMMSKMVDAMATPMHKMIHDMYVKDKDKLPADFEQKQIQIIDEMYRNMPLDELLQAMIPVYQKHLTKGDIDSLIAFYSSPTGQKMLRELPAIMSEAMGQAMPLIEKYAETIQERIQQEFAQALKEPGKNNN